MIAELVKYYFPTWVELHNYSPAHNTQQKMINWGLLNRKVFSRFDLNVPEHVMRGICIGKAGMVENFMYNLRIKIDEYVSVQNIRHVEIILRFFSHLYATEGNTSDPQYRYGFFFGIEVIWEIIIYGFRMLFRKGKDASKTTPRLDNQIEQYDDYEMAPRRQPNGAAREFEMMVQVIVALVLLDSGARFHA